MVGLQKKRSIKDFQKSIQMKIGFRIHPEGMISRENSSTISEFILEKTSG